MKHPFLSISISPALGRQLVLPGAVLLALGLGLVGNRLGLMLPGLLVGLPVAALCLYTLFQNPRVGMVAFVVYCFLVMTINRHLKGAPFGLGMDGLLVLLWLAVLFHRNRQIADWSRVNNDLCKLGLAWFIITVLEIGNPAGASILGWYYEMRGTTFYWFLSVPLVMMLFYKAKDLKLFLTLVIFFSVAGALYGLKQKTFGPESAEQYWLDTGAAKTHVLFGVLRVFSFYSEAAQFGASQAHIMVVCMVLALGPFKWWKRVIFGISAALLLEGMLISGTRGAMFVLVTGVFMYLVLSKQVKVLILGGAIAGLAGGLNAHLTFFIGPNEFGFDRAVDILTMTILGGINSLTGPVVGAVILTLLPEVLRSFKDFRLVVNGFILVLIVLFLPKGFWDPARFRQLLGRLSPRGGRKA